MGDFDRNAKPSETPQTNKLIMCGVLGAVLLGIVGLQISKKTPAPAAAAPAMGGEVAQAPGADESPELLRAALLRDPTQKLLVGEPTRAGGEVPRNPFGMSSVWRKSITREAAPIAATPEPLPRDPVPTVQPQTVQPIQPVALKAGDYKLNMIINSNGQYAALINGVIVSRGQVFRDALVVDVRENGVTLRHKDFANGPALDIPLQPH